MDALANEAILDMQGITEAISKYYYRNGESFDGISVAPEYQDRFERVAIEAIEYHGSQCDYVPIESAENPELVI